MARGSAGYNIQNMNKTIGHLQGLKMDVQVDKGKDTKARRALNAILWQGEDALRDAYNAANSAGVENTDKVKIGRDLEDGWGRIYAEGPGLFFAEFGTGLNLNSGTYRGAMFGYIPASWSLGEGGKGYLTGTRFVIFRGWWPVKEGVKGAEEKEFVTPGGKTITRLAVQGNAPVNGAEIASKKMRDMSLVILQRFFSK